MKSLRAIGVKPELEIKISETYSLTIIIITVFARRYPLERAGWDPGPLWTLSRIRNESLRSSIS